MLDCGGVVVGPADDVVRAAKFADDKTSPGRRTICAPGTGKALPFSQHDVGSGPQQYDIVKVEVFSVL